MEGYLQKWTNYVTGWKTRYCILHNGLLHYCKAQGTSVKGVIHLNISTIVKHQSNNRRFHIDTGCTKVHLKASTAKDADKWIKALLKEQSELKFEDDHREMRSSIQGDSFLEQSRSEIIQEKMGELWSIQAQLEANIDLISSKRQSDPITHIASLSRDLKIIMQEILRLIEEEKSYFMNLNNKFEASNTHLKSLVHDVIQGYSDQREVPMIRLSNRSSSDSFVDARSQMSDDVLNGSIDIDQAFKRVNLPMLRNYYITQDFFRYFDFDTKQKRIKYHEPISYLQRVAEELNYSELLLKADDAQSQELRLAFVTAFAISNYSNLTQRILMPFQPLVGETFELETNGFKFFAEQVSYEITAFHCEHPKYRYWGQVKNDISWNNTSMRIEPQGQTHLEFSQSKELYTWQKCPISLIAENDQFKVLMNGDIKIQMQDSKLASFISFDDNNLTAEITNEAQKVYDLQGDLYIGIDIQDSQNKRIVTGYKTKDYPLAYETSYYFTEFAMQLNMPVELYGSVVKTDSRFRPDIRALENGDYLLANKLLKQLSKRRYELEPRWFKKQSDMFHFTGEYWIQKLEKNFTQIPDIFN